GFVKNELRDAKLKLSSPRLPPFLRELLMAGNYEVSARPRREITRNRCFEVNALCHDGCYSISCRYFRIWLALFFKVVAVWPPTMIFSRVHRGRSTDPGHDRPRQPRRESKICSVNPHAACDCQDAGDN